MLLPSMGTHWSEHVVSALMWVRWWCNRYDWHKYVILYSTVTMCYFEAHLQEETMTLSVWYCSSCCRGVGMADNHMTVCLQIHCAKIVKHPVMGGWGASTSWKVWCLSFTARPSDLSSRTIQTDVDAKRLSGQTGEGQWKLKTDYVLHNSPLAQLS